MKLPLIICAAAFVVCAASAQAGTRIVSNSTAGVIPPEVATAHRIFRYSLLAADGDLVVCPSASWYTYREGTCKDSAGKNQWKKIADVVPKGKTYAGYSIDTYSGELYVFWR